MDQFPHDLAACTGFEWDDGKLEKNWERHRVSAVECEQVFFQRPILLAVDNAHSQNEVRYAALGRSAAHRRLTVVFTVRRKLIRVISARDMSKRERRIYEQG